MANAFIIVVVGVLCVMGSLVEAQPPAVPTPARNATVVERLYQRKTTEAKRFCDNPGEKDSCKGGEMCCKESGHDKAGICCKANACPDETNLERGCLVLNDVGIPIEKNPLAKFARPTTKAARTCENVNTQDSCRDKEFCCPEEVTLDGKTTKGICCDGEAKCPDHSVGEWGCVTKPVAPRPTKRHALACANPGGQDTCLKNEVCCAEENETADQNVGLIRTAGICCRSGACPNKNRGEKGCLVRRVPKLSRPWSA